MPKEKDGYKMHMIVPKPTDPEKLKKREEISRRLREYPNEELKKALEWIQAKKEQEERERKEQEERERKEKSTEEELFDALKWISDGALLNSMAKIEAARAQAEAEQKNKGGSKKK